MRFFLGHIFLAPKVKEGIAIVGRGLTLIRTQHYEVLYISKYYVNLRWVETNPLVFWYQCYYLRLPAKKHIFFCRVSKIGTGKSNIIPFNPYNLISYNPYILRLALNMYILYNRNVGWCTSLGWSLGQNSGIQPAWRSTMIKIAKLFFL